MPELPEVETMRRLLEAAMQDARFLRVEARRPDLRTPFPPDFVEQLEGQAVRFVDRRGKYLLVGLASGATLVMHLGMSGWFRVGPEPPETHDHVVFHMSSGVVITFSDPRRFGFMDIIPAGALHDHHALGALGPEPLADDFDAAALARACRAKTTTLKAALSDQAVVAGLGNIYVCEALHRAQLSPRRRAATIASAAGLPTDAARRLVNAIKYVLNDAIDRGDESTNLRVYDREGRPCRRSGCTGRIKRIVQGGRSTFYCPKCQK